MENHLTDEEEESWTDRGLLKPTIQILRYKKLASL